MNETASTQRFVDKRTAAAIVLGLWVLYTTIYTAPLSDAWHAILEFLPGLLAVVVLWRAGYRNSDWTVQAAPLSRSGLIALLLLLPIILAPVLPALLAGSSVGFHPLVMLLFTPASGVAQELFFRGALLPASVQLCGGKPIHGIVLQAALFGLWHAPKAYLGTPAGTSPWVGVIALTAVTFLGGLGWGWQAHHDRTIVWTTSQHVIFLMIMSLFGM